MRIMQAWRWGAIITFSAAVAAVGCGNEGPSNDGKSGRLSGQVVVSGPLRGGQLSVDQLDDDSGEIIFHVGDAEIDDTGRFTLETGVRNGLMRLTARGGSFTDLATREPVKLDATDELTTVVDVGLLDEVDDVLVSPVGHLIDARTRFALAAGPGGADAAADAYADATRTLSQHFGSVNDWTHLVLVGLDQPAQSPTEPVRAALVQAALSVLAQDIANEAGASPQDVNVFALTRRWAEDLGDGPFDGNDGNDATPGSGLQLGVCPPVDTECATPTACGCRRTLCDVYAGHPRTLLAGAMTKVIANPELNATMLDTADILPVARALNDDQSDVLFGGACVESLDRLPPSVTFLAPTPDELAFVSAAFTVKAIAIDDTDPKPRLRFVGLDDADGDPTNSAAEALIDTAGLPDGALDIVAEASDMAGNPTMVARAVVVDNTAPALALSPAGFFEDGATWWTAKASPTVTGTVTDAAPVTVKAVISGAELDGTVDADGSFSIVLPTSTIDLAGADVSVVATDAAGNQRTVIQRIRADLTPPGLSFQVSTVRDESTETFTSDASFTTAGGVLNGEEIPIHRHTGPAIDLAAESTCPVVTKYSYLLGSQGPPYANEVDGAGNPQRNPISYALIAADDGVGIVAGSTKYKVKRGTTSVLGLTSAGAGTVISAGVRRHDVGVFSDVIAGLDANEGTYTVDFQTTDRLGRTTTVSRCFELRLLAPPMHFTDGGAATGHDRALKALTLAPATSTTFDRIATRLLNTGAFGASIVDQRFVNGTASTVFLTVTVTKPSVSLTKRWVLQNARTSTTAVSLLCGGSGDPANCQPPDLGPVFDSGTVSVAVKAEFPVHVFETDAAGAVIGEIPCTGCANTDTVFKFAIPPRPRGTTALPPRRFIAMTTIVAQTGLQPEDAQHPAAEPFVDATIAGTRISGKLATTSNTGCTKTDFVGPGLERCIERSTVRGYRALKTVTFGFTGVTSAEFATAVTAQLTPVTAVEAKTINFTHTTTEPSLPNFTLP